ncbi:MAG: hypothetical protein AAGJ35_04410 [Myxococcota bacterium]
MLAVGSLLDLIKPFDLRGQTLIPHGKRMILGLCPFLWFCFAQSVASAIHAKPLQPVQPCAKTYAQNRSFTLEFRVQSNSKRLRSVQPPRAKRTRNVRFLRTAKQHQEKVIYRHAKSPSVQHLWTFRFTYRSKRSGAFTLRPGRLRLGKQAFTLAGCTFRVVPPQQDTRIRIPAPQLSAKHLKQNFFLLAVNSHKHLYRGQQNTLTFYFFRQPSCGASYAQMPRFESFWVEQLFRKRQLSSWNTMMYRGRRFAYTKLAQYALFPLRHGQIEIDPLSLYVDPSMGADTQQRMRIQAPVTTLEVRPLPRFKKAQRTRLPPDVGQYRFRRSKPPHNLIVNQPFSITWTRSGIGNLRQLSALSFKLPPALQLISSRTHLEKRIKDSQIQGAHHTTLWLKSAKPGKVTLPAIQWSHFDPWKRRWITQQTPSDELSFAPAQSVPQNDARQNTQRRLIAQDTNQPSRQAAQQWTLLLLLFLSLCVTIALVIQLLQRLQRKIRRQREQRLEQDEYQQRYEAVKQCLLNWQQSPPHSKKDLSLLEAHCHALFPFFTPHPTRPLTRHQLQSLLQEALPSAHNLIVAMLQLCDIARFAPWPSPHTPQQIQEQLQRLQQLLPQRLTLQE